MLGQRRRRWPNIISTSTQHIVLAGKILSVVLVVNIYLSLYLPLLSYDYKVLAHHNHDNAADTISLVSQGRQVYRILHLNDHIRHCIMLLCKGLTLTIVTVIDCNFLLEQ